ncbi:uncharacterized protein PODANS_2_12220 [Podospora anserina S mat+]|uniref:Podospora anserina S mat+ genomic DNA chromosome 2, supercontig 2 n=1 Tax=Podospora anserina (strain S / ATCC MYA-4624 / DSM 980 / FGSC 10383) TaxID=515849 RepID=B2B7T8_PODAN|nr:uncharacterized protein PODANS_2_12220 [Podospora anserina S mat+]CAP73867.1 unnamed protein product [Podospora anserina S mat+]CDP26266.1 Putative protein of unknown function [Podospora anserina S mat+]
MDDSRGQRRQNDPPTYSRQHHPALQAQAGQDRRSFTGTQRDSRFQTTSLSSSPAGSSRGMGGSAGYGAYYQDSTTTSFPTTAMTQGALGYHHSAADYGQPDSRQTQSFAGTYNPSMMYNVQQATGGQSAGVYDASQQFSSRQAAGLPMMTDVTAPYFSSEPTNTTSALQAQAQTSSTPQVYQQPGLHGYSTSSMAAIGGITTQTTPAAEVRMEEEYPATGGLDDAYAQYQSALKGIFKDIRNGALATAGESLLQVSTWLLGHVVELGLTSDDQNLHGERIKLWNDFNYAWLGMFQRQKEMIESGQQLQRSQSLVPQEELEKMAKELIKYCDNIERHGLVDYQYGVWEEQIIEILGECVDLYESANASGSSGGEGSSSSRRR